MLTNYEELGDRPAVLTKARRNAPQFARRIAALLSVEEWADSSDVVLDWSDVSDRLPFPYPVLYVRAYKGIPGVGLLRQELRYDVDDVFSSDVMSATILLDIVHDLQVAVDAEIVKGPPK